MSMEGDKKVYVVETDRGFERYEILRVISTKKKAVDFANLYDRWHSDFNLQDIEKRFISEDVDLPDLLFYGDGDGDFPFGGLTHETYDFIGMHTLYKVMPEFLEKYNLTERDGALLQIYQKLFNCPEDPCVILEYTLDGGQEKPNVIDR